MPIVFGTGQDDEISPSGVSPGVIGIPSKEDPNFIHGGNGNDTIYGGDGEDWICGGNGNDVIWAARSYVSFTPNHLFGGNGDDLLFGSTADDHLYGGNGNDTLLGGDLEYEHGKDFLSGGAGDDLLDGVKGSDTLLGGPGQDTFRFAIGITGPAPASTSLPGDGNRDVILDFHPGEDTIDLSGYQDFYNAAGHAAFLGTAPFGTSDDLQVRYDIVGGHTIVQFRSAVNEVWYLPTEGEIDLVGVFHLNAADFHLA